MLRIGPKEPGGGDRGGASCLWSFPGRWCPPRACRTSYQPRVLHFSTPVCTYLCTRIQGMGQSRRRPRTLGIYVNTYSVRSSGADLLPGTLYLLYLGTYAEKSSPQTDLSCRITEPRDCERQEKGEKQATVARSLRRLRLERDLYLEAFRAGPVSRIPNFHTELSGLEAVGFPASPSSPKH